MRTLQAQVRKGRLVLNEPTKLPEGTIIELAIADTGDDLDDGERAALHEALDGSWASARAGRSRPAKEIVRELQTRR